MLLCWSFFPTSCFLLGMLSQLLDTQSSHNILQYYSEKQYPYNYKHRLNPSQTYSQERGRSTCDIYRHGIFEANVKSTPPCRPHDGLEPELPAYCDEFPTTAFQRARPTNQTVRPHTDIKKIYLVKYLINCARFVYCIQYWRESIYSPQAREGHFIISPFSHCPVPRYART